MTNFSTPSNSNLKDIARNYKAFGFNITCMSSKLNDFNKLTSNFFKTPCQKWEHLSINNQSNLEFEQNDWENAIGVGTVTKWNNLFVIDIDGCNDRDLINEMLQKLGLPVDYEWVVESGSNNGFHIYLYGERLKECKEEDVVSTFPPKSIYEGLFDKIEFLWETHCVLPPSVHGSGNRYNFINKNFPINQPKNINRDSVYDFIEEYLEFDEIVNGQGYFGTTLKIQSNEEFLSETKSVDLTKYLLDEVYCIVDIETTGFPQMVNDKKIYPEILQVAWVLTNSKGTLLKKKSFITDSDFFVKNMSSDFTNIDFEVARMVGFPINEIMSKFVEDLKISDFIVSHNTDFDIDILSNYFLVNFNTNPFSKKKIICTMKSSVDYCKIESRYGFKYPKLNELYEKLFNYKISNSHNAEIDVLHTLKCFKKLKKLKII
jgi:DNA polymerase III epsilon subunit-like protein